MRKLRIFGIVGLVFGILVLIAGLVLVVLTLLTIVIILPILPFTGGSIPSTVFLPALATIGVGILLIIVSIIAIAKGGTKKSGAPQVSA